MQNLSNIEAKLKKYVVFFKKYVHNYHQKVDVQVSLRVVKHTA